MAKQFPIVKVVLPSDLKGCKAGEIPANLLRPIEGKGRLHRLAADCYEAMDAAANAEGIDLSPTSPADTYRTLAVQEYGFYQRYTTEVVKGEKPRVYKGIPYYLKKGNAMMAVPGTSKHNLGIAVDIRDSTNPKRLRWLADNAVSFGFSWEALPSEPWHLRYVAGDDIPERVTAWLAAKTV